MKNRSLLAGVLVIVLVVPGLLLWQCRQVKPAGPATQAAAPSDSYAENEARFRYVLGTPVPAVVFTPPPPPPPVPQVEPEPVRPRPASKPVRRPPAASPARQAAPVARPAAQETRPVAAPAIESGVYYVVRQKVQRNGGHYVICSIMGDASKRYFGYAVSAEQYARAEPGLVYDYKNMTGWRRVNRLE